LEDSVDLNLWRALREKLVEKGSVILVEPFEEESFQLAPRAGVAGSK
jgi:hypothetical protein